MISDAHINELVLAIERGDISQEDASRLVRDSVFSATTAPASGAQAKASEPQPWERFKQADMRIPMKQLADSLQRRAAADGRPMSDLEVLTLAVHMNQHEAANAAPLIAEEAKRYDERATAAAQREYANTPAGIAEAGRLRQAQAEALKQHAADMRPELAARGLPAESMSDQEVVGWVNDMAEKRAADAEANSLAANVQRIAELETEKGGTQA